MSQSTLILVLVGLAAFYLLTQNQRPLAAAPLTNNPTGGKQPAGVVDVINTGLGFVDDIFKALQPTAQTQPQSN